MSLKKLILQMAQRKKKIQTSDVMEKSQQYSRQYIIQNLKQLVQEKQLVRIGAGAGTFYTLPSNVMDLKSQLKKKYQNKNLTEDEIYNDFQQALQLKKRLKDNLYHIFYYSFSEMVNNAIEHSQSKQIQVKYYDNKKSLNFEVRDFGIGAFKNVMKKRNLKSEIEAVQDILKGKITTNPVRHSGQGIFFTSKIADLFIIESFGYRLRIDNSIPDIFIEEISPELKGTKVLFSINLKTTKKLADVFYQYQTDKTNYNFNKTSVLVKLYTLGTEYISRSQARRLTSGLEKYEHIILDFQKVTTIGQAFADEIFRVFKSQNPDIVLEPINMEKTVEFMIKRVD